MSSAQAQRSSQGSMLGWLVSMFRFNAQSGQEESEPWSNRESGESAPDSQPALVEPPISAKEWYQEYATAEGILVQFGPQREERKVLTDD